MWSLTFPVSRAVLLLEVFLSRYDPYESKLSKRILVEGSSFKPGDASGDVATGNWVWILRVGPYGTYGVSHVQMWTSLRPKLSNYRNRPTRTLKSGPTMRVHLVPLRISFYFYESYASSTYELSIFLYQTRGRLHVSS